VLSISCHAAEVHNGVFASELVNAPAAFLAGQAMRQPGGGGVQPIAVVNAHHTALMLPCNFGDQSIISTRRFI
jgi:hypothetical protein